MAKVSALSDEELIGLLRSDDGAALEEIYERYHQPLFRFIRKYLYAEGPAEDISQNVFIKFREQRHEPVAGGLPVYEGQKGRLWISCAGRRRNRRRWA